MKPLAIYHSPSQTSPDLVSLPFLCCELDTIYCIIKDTAFERRRISFRRHHLGALTRPWSATPITNEPQLALFRAVLPFTPKPHSPVLAACWPLPHDILPRAAAALCCDSRPAQTFLADLVAVTVTVTVTARTCLSPGAALDSTHNTTPRRSVPLSAARRPPPAAHLKPKACMSAAVLCTFAALYRGVDPSHVRQLAT